MYSLCVHFFVTFDFVCLDGYICENKDKSLLHAEIDLALSPSLTHSLLILHVFLFCTAAENIKKYILVYIAVFAPQPSFFALITILSIFSIFCILKQNMPSFSLSQAIFITSDK